MASDIQITSLTAVGGVQSIALLAEAAAPAIQSSLPYMQMASVVFYISATNDFGIATVAGESVTGVLSVGGLPLSATRYIWARAKDPAGNLGPRFPAGSGVSVTTQSTNPGPNSVGPTELQDNAVTTTKIANLAVTNAKIDSMSANKITAGIISALVEILSPTITGGTIRTGTGSSRVEMSASLNAVSVFAGGIERARFGSDNGNGYLTIFNNNSTPAAYFTAGVNSSIDSAVRINNIGNAAAIYASASSSGSFAHGVRGQSISGGSGVLGLSSAAGGYAVYAEIGSYGPFTGAHDALLPKNSTAMVGEIVCSTGRVIAKSGVDDALLEVGVSETEKQRGTFGIVSRITEFDPMSNIAALPPITNETQPTPIRKWIAENYQRLTVNGCGEGLILVCGRGGNIEVGDYISTSSMRGKGQRQNDTNGEADDLLRRHTVAQATQNISFESADEIKLIACVYKCG